MKYNLKLFGKPFLLVFLLCSGLVLWNSCQTDKASEKDLIEDELSESDANEDKWNDETMVEMFYRKDAVLLSIKYGIDESHVFEIISSENPVLSEVQISAEDFEENLFGLNTRAHIIEYSEKYNIPPETVASLLIDYYAMNCSGDY